MAALPAHHDPRAVVQVVHTENRFSRGRAQASAWCGGTRTHSRACQHTRRCAQLKTTTLCHQRTGCSRATVAARFVERNSLPLAEGVLTARACGLLPTSRRLSSRKSNRTFFVPTQARNQGCFSLAKDTRRVSQLCMAETLGRTWREILPPMCLLL